MPIVKIKHKYPQTYTLHPRLLKFCEYKVKAMLSMYGYHKKNVYLGNVFYDIMLFCRLYRAETTTKHWCFRERALSNLTFNDYILVCLYKKLESTFVSRICTLCTFFFLNIMMKGKRKSQSLANKASNI